MGDIYWDLFGCPTVMVATSSQLNQLGWANTDSLNSVESPEFSKVHPVGDLVARRLTGDLSTRPQREIKISRQGFFNRIECVILTI